MTRTATGLTVLSLALAACAPSQTFTLENGNALRDSVEVEGNPTCAELGFDGIEVKIDPPMSGEYVIVDGYTVRVETDGDTWSFDSDLGVDAAISKGSDGAIVTTYDPEVLSDSGLEAPVNSSGDSAALSHMQLCIDFELEVEVEVESAFARLWDWAIDKVGGAASLLLSHGQTYAMDYTVSLETTGYSDSDWGMGARAFISNPSPFPANVTSVEATLDGQPLALDCGQAMPLTLEAGGSFRCDAAADLPSDTDFEVRVVATTDGGAVGDGEASATGSFADATIDEIDACVAVDDNPYGPLGTVCVGDAEMSFSYLLDIRADSCEAFDFLNVACLETGDTGTEACASWTVNVNVACESGCSLTPGYWKTHSEAGPAPYDDTWSQLPYGASTPFFHSGDSWYGVLWTPPAGNPYYILAHAFQAAYLNQLNGADSSAITAELAEAEAFFDTHTPADRLNGRDRNAIIVLAEVLDDYNNGLIGPGHCDE